MSVAVHPSAYVSCVCLYHNKQTFAGAAGGSSLADEGPSSSSSSAAAQAQSTPNVLGQVAPIYVVNDVNLLTLMDTVKLLMDATGG